MEQQALTALQALAHPRRLALFRLLMRRFPDALAAGELARLLQVPPSTLSPALAQLRQAGLIDQTRRGTTLDYAASPQGAQAMIAYLAEDCCRGRPEICFAPETSPPRNVLFLCTGNSARSIMAETLLRSLAKNRFAVYSAGTRPGAQANPLALRLLRAHGHDTKALRPKPLRDFQTGDAPRMDLVLTVCDRAANEDSPPLPGLPVTSHWGLPDPAQVPGPEAQRQKAFQQTYDRLSARLTRLVALPLDSLDRAALQTHLDQIARMKDPA